ncbi:MAG: response regulator [gamma proteobacterium symbiont of Phacoides pectinatus]
MGFLFRAISPCLLYVWIFISYGTRYGKRHLRAASLLSFAAYLAVLIHFDQWHVAAFDSLFFLFSLLIIPFYQYMLLNKVHQARLEAERANRANRAKSAFLSTMTHELNTPLNGIVGMTRLLQATPLNPVQEEYVQSIATSGSLLGSLVGNVLDLTSLESSHLELDEKRFSFRPLVRDVCLALSARALEKRLEILCDIDPRLPDQLVGDPWRIRQVLYCLISNAVKFTTQGCVDLRVFPLDGGPHWLRLEVEDTGIGIEDELLERVFEPFWQADATTTAQNDGAGLGSTLAKGLVEAKGGRIGAESQVGHGSLFWFELPLLAGMALENRQQGPRFRGLHCLLIEISSVGNARLSLMLEAMGISCRSVEQVSTLAAEVSRLEDQRRIDFVVLADTPLRHDLLRLSEILRGHLGAGLPIIYLGFSGKKFLGSGVNSLFLAKPVTRELLEGAVAALFPGSAPQTPREPSSPLQVVSGERRIRVLMAEDNSINAGVLRALLGSLGLEVDWVKDGEEALRMARERRHDLAVVDLRMPKLDGIGFVKQWRTLEEEGEHLPVIALTANASSSVRRECLEAGMDDFLVKPVDRDTLATVLFGHLNHHARGRE